MAEFSAQTAPTTAPWLAWLGRGRRPAAAVGAIVALAVAAGLPAIRGDFFSDDLIYVAENAGLAATPLTEPWRFFLERTNPLEYLPLRDLSYRLDLALFGLSPAGFHATNLLLYGLACVAAFLAAREVVRLLRGDDASGAAPALAVVAAALFALHPGHVEASAWIASRKDVLSGLFALLSLWQVARAIRGPAVEWRRVAGAATLYLAAVFSKATVVPLVAIVALLAAARWVPPEGLRRAVARGAPVVAPFLLVAVISLLSTRGATAGTAVADELNVYGARPVAAWELPLRILGEFLRASLAPVSLRLHHDVRQAGAEGWLLVALGIVAASAAAAGAVACVRRGSIAGFGAAAFVLFSAPYLQLVPFSGWSEMCERWLFLPIFGLALVLAAAAERAVQRAGSAAVLAGLAVLLAAGLGLTAHRSWEWGSPSRLVAVNLARSGRHTGAVALALEDWSRRLDFPAARATAAAMDAGGFRYRVLLIADGWQALAEGRREDARRAVKALASLSLLRLTSLVEGDLAERAGEDFEAVRFYQLGQFETRLSAIRGRYSRDLERLAAAARERPGDPSAPFLLGNLQTELRLDDEAAASYREALARDPNLASARFNLAMVLRLSGDFGGAAEQYRVVAAAIPSAWNDVGICEKRLGRREAAEQAFRAGMAADPRAWMPAYNLALSYLEWGRRDEAVRTIQEARARAVSSGAPTEPLDVLLERAAR